MALITPTKLRIRRWRALYDDPVTRARIQASHDPEMYWKHIERAIHTGATEGSLLSWEEWVDEWRLKR